MVLSLQPKVVLTVSTAGLAGLKEAAYVTCRWVLFRGAV